MIKKVGRLAEEVATGVSRRRFLGRLGQGALTVAAAVAGLLAVPAIAQASGRFITCCHGEGCAKLHGCTLVSNCFNYGNQCQWDCNGATVYNLCGGF